MTTTYQQYGQRFIGGHMVIYKLRAKLSPSQQEELVKHFGSMHLTIMRSVSNSDYVVIEGIVLSASIRSWQRLFRRLMALNKAQRVLKRAQIVLTQEETEELVRSLDETEDIDLPF